MYYNNTSHIIKIMKIFLFTAILLSAFCVANVTNTTSITIDEAVTLTFSGDFSNEGSVINNGTIQVAGVINSNGIFTNDSGSTVEFNGNDGQNINNDLFYYNQVIISGEGTKYLYGDINVSESITLTTGLLGLNEGNLHLSNGNLYEQPGYPITSSNPSSYGIIYSGVTTPQENINYGNIGAEIYVDVEDDITVSRFSSTEYSSSGLSIARKYHIQTSETMGDLIFHYDESELNGSNEANLSIFKADEDSWTNIESIVDTEANSITITEAELPGTFIAAEIGCTEPFASNYSQNAFEDDGSCSYNISLELHNGNNLIEFNVFPIDLDILPECVVAVIGEGVAASHLGNGVWVGSLQEFNCHSGYWIKAVDDGCTIEYTGDETCPTDGYVLHPGNNLISYPCFLPSSLGDTIGEEYTEGIIGVIGEGVAATNINGNWVGSLESFNPNGGYWMVLSDSLDFGFNCPEDVTERFVIKEIKTIPEEFKVIQSTQQAFYFVETITIDGKQLEDDDLLLAYHNNVLVGSRYWNGAYTDIPTMGLDNTETSVGFCKKGTVPNFKVFRGKTGELIKLNGDIPEWQNNIIYVISSLTGTLIMIPEEYSLSTPYPNPFNPVTTISYGLPEDSKVKISIFDVKGREIVELVNTLQSTGYHKYVWDANSYASGVYFVSMQSSSFNKIQKILLVK